MGDQPRIRIVSTDEIETLSQKAAASARRRANLNLHPTLEDPVQRFFNALQPGSYVRPHRHLNPEKWEFFLCLSGRMVVLCFDEAGVVTERIELDAEGGNRGVEVPIGAWHTVAALEPNTVVFELKQGPYAAASDKDCAAWAPNEGEVGAERFERWYHTAQVGERPPGCD